MPLTDRRLGIVVLASYVQNTGQEHKGIRRGQLSRLDSGAIRVRLRRSLFSCSHREICMVTTELAQIA